MTTYAWEAYMHSAQLIPRRLPTSTSSCCICTKNFLEAELLFLAQSRTKHEQAKSLAYLVKCGKLAREMLVSSESLKDSIQGTVISEVWQVWQLCFSEEDARMHACTYEFCIHIYCLLYETLTHSSDHYSQMRILLHQFLFLESTVTTPSRWIHWLFVLHGNQPD